MIPVTIEQSHDGILPTSTRKAWVVNTVSYKNGLSCGNGWAHIDRWSELVMDYITSVEKKTAE